MKKKKPAPPALPVLEFGNGQLVVTRNRNTLLIYRVNEKFPIGQALEGTADKGAPLVCAWHFTDPRSVFVVIRALSAIGMGHQQDEIFVAGGEAKE